MNAELPVEAIVIVLPEGVNVILEPATNVLGGGEPKGNKLISRSYVANTVATMNGD